LRAERASTTVFTDPGVGIHRFQPGLEPILGARVLGDFVDDPHPLPRNPRLCRRHVKTGSGPLSVIELALSSCGEQDAFAEQVEFGSAVHLSFDHFKSYVESDRRDDHARR
jgi:hypothetical protein